MKQKTPSPGPAESQAKSGSASYLEDLRPESQAQADFIASIPSSPGMTMQARMVNLIQGKPQAKTPEKPVIQRVMAVQITADKIPLNVGLINVVGRPKSPYKGTMGDHSTAFITHVLGIRMHMEGKSFVNALKGMNKLTNDLGALPGIKFVDHLPLEHKQRFLHEHKALKEFQNQAQKIKAPTADLPGFLQEYIAHYLEVRELMPFSTINVRAKNVAKAGKGKGEFTHGNNLANIESKGPPKNAKKEEVKAFVLKCIYGLFDAAGVGMMAVEQNANVLQKMAPGMDPKMGQKERFALVWKQHLTTIATNFPTAFKVSGLKIGDPLPQALHNKLNFEAGNEINETLQEIKIQQNYAEKAILTIGSTPKSSRVPYNGVRMKTGQRDYLIACQNFEKAISIATSSITVVKRLMSAIGKTNEKLLLQMKLSMEKLVLTKKNVESGNYAPVLNHENKRRSNRIKTKNTPSESLHVDLSDFSNDNSNSKNSNNNLKVKRDEDTVVSRQGVQLIVRNGEIKNVLFAGRPESPFPGTMGAHTTAWAIHQDHVRNRLLGKSLVAGILTMDKDLLPYALKLRSTAPKGKKNGKAAYGRQEFGNRLQTFQSLDKKSLPPIRYTSFLQAYIADYFQFINYIPSVTKEKVNTDGHGEAAHRAVLVNHESGLKTSSKQQLDIAVKGLFDGRPNGKMWNNHKLLIQRTYPKCYKTLYS